MIVRNLAADVVSNMSLRDTVSSNGTEPTHELSTVAEELTIQGTKSATGESELGSTVVGKKGVGVLQERDEDKPVIDPVELRKNEVLPRDEMWRSVRTKGKEQGKYGRR